MLLAGRIRPGAQHNLTKSILIHLVQLWHFVYHVYCAFIGKCEVEPIRVACTFYINIIALSLGQGY